MCRYTKKLEVLRDYFARNLNPSHKIYNYVDGHVTVLYMHNGRANLQIKYSTNSEIIPYTKTPKNVKRQLKYMEAHFRGFANPLSVLLYYATGIAF